MIISEKHRYLFIEIPHTGSTTISNELRGLYDGREILYKHASYREFLRSATPDQRRYFVFAGIRNPVDEAISVYHRFLSNHKGQYTDPRRHIERGGWITKRKRAIFELVQSTRDFGKFLRKFYPVVYTSTINLDKRHCDAIMKFEDLQADFAHVLERLGITMVRPLPLINPTRKEGGVGDHYRDEIIPHAVRLFGPFMEEWGYALPEEWPGARVTPRDRAVYALAKLGHRAHARLARGRSRRRRYTEALVNEINGTRAGDPGVE